MSTTVNKSKKPTTLKESARFWWSVFWRPHLISIALLIFVTCGFYVTNSNNGTVDNLLLGMYLFVILAGILSKSRIYQVIFNNGLLKYSAIKDLNITKIKIGKFSI